MDETPLSSPIALPIANTDETPPLQITFPSSTSTRGRPTTRTVRNRLARRQLQERNTSPTTTISTATSNNNNIPTTTTTSSPSISDFEQTVNSLNAIDAQEADGGNSDVEGEEAEILDESFQCSNVERDENEHSLFSLMNISSGDIGFVLSKDRTITSEGILDSIPIPEKPEGWVRPAKRTTAIETEEPDFEDLDNPGNWNDYIYRPVYSKSYGSMFNTSNYIRHELPTGCSVVPKNDEGKRIDNGWEFFYDGWESTRAEKARSGAGPTNLFPEERNSTLDKDILQRLGLNKERMKDCDSLFFFQLLLPFCNPKLSGIHEDPRKSFYTDVTKYSNLYKIQNDVGVTYGHKIDEVQMPELVHFDGVVVRDGVCGGGDGSLYLRWQSSSSAFDKLIPDSISLQRWHQLKRIYKLNNNDTAKKKGEEGYDPCYKYDLIYDCIVKNTIALTANGALDLTGDETTWGHQGYGEKGGGNLFRVVGKPGITKGGQIVLVSSSTRVRPYWYQHRHKHTKRYGTGFKAEGQSEVRSCIDYLEGMVQGSEGTLKKIFKEGPHLTFDNYFSGEEVCNYAGKKGFGLLVTTRRDRLPKQVKSHYLHKKKTDSSLRTKIARYLQPVVAVKSIPGENYEIVHTSFQSTSSCNIMSVNSLSENKNFVEARSRGRKDNKRIYGIEQNHARLLYLNTYSRIDSLDHMIKNCKLFYTSWKYWHSPVLHAKALAIVTAYDIYLECAEGKLDPSWHIHHPVTFRTFRDILSQQMLQYDPKHQHYPGDEKMRVVTQLNKKKGSHV